MNRSSGEFAPMTAPVALRKLMHPIFSSSELFKAALNAVWDAPGTSWEALGREMASR